MFGTLKGSGSMSRRALLGTGTAGVVAAVPIAAGASQNADQVDLFTPAQHRRKPLGPDLDRLPTIKAKPWLYLSDLEFHVEGPAFDRDGNLFVHLSGKASPQRSTIKIAPNGKITRIFSSTTVSMSGTTIHKDGRLFVACTTGQMLIMQPDGTNVLTLEPTYDGQNLYPNDGVFDSAGNLYFTDFEGNPLNPLGGVYRLEASDDYQTVTRIVKGLGPANGISLTPDGTGLWVAETGSNRIFHIDLQPDGVTVLPSGGVNIPYRLTGYPGGPDGNRVDADGNLYQAVMFQGRAIILNSNGIPVANVVVPGRENGEQLMTANLAIRPGTKTVYLTASGEGGSQLYTFQGLAKALTLYSHQ